MEYKKRTAAFTRWNQDGEIGMKQYSRGELKVNICDQYRVDKRKKNRNRHSTMNRCMRKSREFMIIVRNVCSIITKRENSNADDSGKIGQNYYC